jgi:hypothetical protein
MLPLLLLLSLVPPSSYRQEIERWRARQEVSLKADDGRLTVAGLFWLKEGSNEIDLPEDAPKFGTFELRSGKVTFHPAEGGAPVEMRPDTSGRPATITRGAVSVFVIQRGQRIGIRLKDKNSKLRREFNGRHWYPVKGEYRMEAKWVAYDPPKPIAIPNVLGDKSEEKAPGYAAFTLSGKEYRLEPLGEGGELFFIFKDRTSGRETYGAGRFLYAAAPQDGTVILDFNKAVNPPCAFTPYATCPLPPP